MFQLPDAQQRNNTDNNAGNATHFGDLQGLENLKNLTLFCREPLQTEYFSPRQQARFFILGVVMPTLALFGLLGNVLIVFVHTRPVLRHLRVLQYLCALSISDSGVIVNYVFVAALQQYRLFHPCIHHLSVYAAVWVSPVGLWFHTISTYLVIMAGVEGVLTIRSAMCCEHKTRLPRPTTVIGCVILFSTLYNLVHFFEQRVIHCYSRRWQRNSVAVQMRVLYTRGSMYHTIYYVWLYPVLLGILPVLFTTALAWRIHFYLYSQRLSSTGRRHSVAARMRRRANEGALDLFVVLVLFVGCSLFSLLLTGVSLMIRPVVPYLMTLSPLILTVNVSVAFLIHYEFSRRFRRTLWRTLFGRTGLARRHATRRKFTPRSFTNRHIATTRDHERYINQRYMLTGDTSQGMTTGKRSFDQTYPMRRRRTLANIQFVQRSTNDEEHKLWGALNGGSGKRIQVADVLHHSMCNGKAKHNRQHRERILLFNKDGYRVELITDNSPSLV